MNTWERFHIYKLSTDNLQMIDTYTDIHNPILNLIKNQYNGKNQYYFPSTPTIVPHPLSLTPYAHHNQK
jgi:hypothetical protein